MKPNLRAILGIVATILLLRVMGCIHSAGAHSTVPTNPRNLYPVIIDMGELWDSVEKTFLVTMDLTTAHCPLDWLYVLPTAKQVDQIEANRQRFAEGGPGNENSKDCDDFAREATYWAKRWGHTNYVGLPATVTYGTAYIRLVGRYPLGTNMDRSPAQPSYHAINIYRRSDGIWFFFEPQNGRSEQALSLIYEGVVEVVRVEI